MGKQGITLIGMPGSGKTTLGRLIALELNLEFVDLDDLIAQSTTMSPNQYLEQCGENAVLLLEEELTLKLNFQNKVFSPGGSIVYSLKAMDKLKKETFVIYLEIPKEMLKQRIKNIDTRAIIGLKEHGFDQLFDLRSPLYKKFADITIQIRNESEEVIKEKILNNIKLSFLRMQESN